MSSIQNTIQWYDAHAGDLAPLYEALRPDAVHGWLADLMPAAPGLVIDIGAGTGRDAAWFASKGFEVMAVEPSAAMQAEAGRVDIERKTKIKWVTDRLPSLSATLALGLAADVVFLGAVWMHLPPDDRPRAFRKLVSLTKSGGLIAISIRNGAPDDVRGFHPASVEELERLARGHGLAVVRVAHAKDALGRDDVSWDCIAMRPPDDGTDALPLLRHIVLNDDKTSSYKLGLLRSLCRAADGSAGMARESGDDHVAVPLGLVALNWLRLYLPLIKSDLPQSAINRSGGVSLGFVGDGAAAIVAGIVPLIDLRIGASFSGVTANTVHSALYDAARTIRKNPATYTTYPKGGPIFPFEPGVRRAMSEVLTLDAQYLDSFGWLLVPRDVWRALQRFGAWVEPSVVAEWIRLMKGYAGRQDRVLDDGKIAAATVWSDPVRDVAVSRNIALTMMENGDPVHCVWSGRRLVDKDMLDIDHCFPWSAWPCGDLWNLMPAERKINQSKKKDKLPSEDLLRRSHNRVVGWWERAYLAPGGIATPSRFRSEARASLPALAGEEGELGSEEVFAGMRFQRLRLWRDQQIPEWDG